jgi:hypothetical protein
MEFEKEKNEKKYEFSLIYRVRMKKKKKIFLSIDRPQFCILSPTLSGFESSALFLLVRALSQIPDKKLLNESVCLLSINLSVYRSDFVTEQTFPFFFFFLFFLRLVNGASQRGFPNRRVLQPGISRSCLKG